MIKLVKKYNDFIESLIALIDYTGSDGGYNVIKFINLELDEKKKAKLLAETKNKLNDLIKSMEYIVVPCDEDGNPEYDALSDDDLFAFKNGADKMIDIVEKADGGSIGRLTFCYLYHDFTSFLKNHRVYYRDEKNFDAILKEDVFKVSIADHFVSSREKEKK